MKKITKYFSLAVMTLAGAAMVSSCDDSKNIDSFTEYTGAPGVYFSETVPSTVQVTEDSSTVSYPVFREDDSAAQTVNITVTPMEDYADDLYTFPSSVTFEAGEKEAEFVISYDITKIAYDEPQYYELTLEGVTVSPFGLGTVEIAITYPAPWNLVGTGYFVDGFWLDFEGETPIYQNELDSKKYRIPNFWNEATDWFEFELLENGVPFQCEFMGDWYNIPTEGDDLVGFQTIYVFTDEDIDFYYVMPAFYGYSDDHCYVAGYKDDGTPGEIRLSPLVIDPVEGYWYGDTSKEELISIIFPGYDPMDTSLEVEYDGILSKDNNMSVQGYVNVGADLTNVKVGVGAGNNAANIASGIEDGSISSVEITVSGSVKIPFDSSNESGRYTIVAVGYVGDEAVSTASATFNYTSTTAPEPDEGNWKDLGFVSYTDGYVCASWFIYYGTIESYYVPIQESEETPGLYRLVNPYGEYFPWNEPGDWDESVTSYLYIDATDPNCVIIPYCEQTLEWQASQGSLSCYSYASYILETDGTLDDVMEKEANGVLADGQITFQALKLLVNWSGEPDKLNYVNYALDYEKYENGSDDPYFYDSMGELVAPFCVNFNDMVSSQAAYKADAAMKKLTKKPRLAASARFFKQLIEKKDNSAKPARKSIGNKTLSNKASKLTKTMAPAKALNPVK